MPLESRIAVTAEPDGVGFEFAVTNGNTEPVELTFRSGRVADFEVYEGEEPSADAEPVWRWSDGRMFTQQFTTDRLDPGETVVHTGMWADPPSGRYTVIGRLDAIDSTATARAVFEV